MRPSFFLIILTCLSLLTPARAQELTLQNLPAGMVLDGDRPIETSQTIERAAKANQIEVLYLAMHNLIDYPTCFKQMKTLERTKHAQLLSRMLVDEKIIRPKEAPLPVWSFAESETRLVEAVHDAYMLMGEPWPEHDINLTRAELAALAARVRPSTEGTRGPAGEAKRKRIRAGQPDVFRPATPEVDSGVRGRTTTSFLPPESSKFWFPPRPKVVH